MTKQYKKNEEGALAEVDALIVEAGKVGVVEVSQEKDPSPDSNEEGGNISE